MKEQQPRIPSVTILIFNSLIREISNLMGRESADTKTKGWFQLRMAASQNIQNKMTNEDILKLRRKGQEMWEVGLPEELQRK